MNDIELSELEFFEDFTAAEVAQIRSVAEEVTAEVGAVLMEQGDVGRETFVIRSGQAGVFVNGHRVATVGPNSMVGEMALVDQRPRSATVRALTDLELLCFSSVAFGQLLESMPKVASRVIEQLNDKLRHQNQQR